MSVNYQNDNFPLEKKIFVRNFVIKKRQFPRRQNIYFFIIWQYIYIYYIYICVNFYKLYKIICDVKSKSFFTCLSDLLL